MANANGINFLFLFKREGQFSQKLLSRECHSLTFKCFEIISLYSLVAPKDLDLSA